MACKDMNRIIEDTPVYVRQWPASTAIENLNKALQVFGGNLTPFIEGDYKFGDVIRILHTADKEELMPLLKDFVCAARIDGVEVTASTFNMQYSGRLNFVFNIFAFVCEVQYKDFFEQGLKLTDQEQPQQE